MVRFLDKDSEMGLLVELCDIFSQNMACIAPSWEEKAEWIACVGEALDKPPRQMLLLYAGETLAGFCMYYIRGELLMVEEVQIKGVYQRTLVAAELFRFMRLNLLPRVRRIEAYADRRNTASQRLMEKMGMEQIENDGIFLHYRGNVPQI